MRRMRAIVTVLVLCMTLCAALGAAPAKIKVLMVTGHDVDVHNWRETTPHERATLEATGRFDVKVCEDTGIFEASTIHRYDVIVLNFGFWNVPQLTKAAQDNLLTFVRNGKGLVSLHFSSSSYQDWEEYRELLGRVWVRGVSGHGPRSVFTVKVEDAGHPIMKGIEDFEVDDELYAKLQGTADIKVLASAYSPFSEKVEPMVFLKDYGQGRVVRNVLGHDNKVRALESYKKILYRSVEWAATGKVTLD